MYQLNYYQIMLHDILAGKKCLSGETQNRLQRSSAKFIRWWVSALYGTLRYLSGIPIVNSATQYHSVEGFDFFVWNNAAFFQEYCPVSFPKVDFDYLCSIITTKHVPFLRKQIYIHVLPSLTCRTFLSSQMETFRPWQTLQHLPWQQNQISTTTVM